MGCSPTTTTHTHTRGLLALFTAGCALRARSWAPGGEQSAEQASSSSLSWHVGVRRLPGGSALTIEMSVPEARPPTAPESWLRVGSAPPLGIKASTTSHPTSQAGSERDSAPDTARAQTPCPSDRTGPPRSSPHTITHRQIECLSQADSTDKRGERERRERERGEGRG